MLLNDIPEITIGGAVDKIVAYAYFFDMVVYAANWKLDAETVMKGALSPSERGRGFRLPAEQESDENMSGQDKGTAVVTGASSGLGAIYADRLAKKGYDLVLVARRADRLEALANDIRIRSGRHVTVMVADLADDSDLRRVEQVISADERVSLLVNNAGLGGQQVVASASANAIERQINVNVVALTRLTRAVLPGLIARDHGAIVNIASVVAFDTGLGGIYSGTKAYVVNFTEGLQTELAGTKVSAQIVIPGPIRTEFWDVAGDDVSRLPQEIIMTGEDLVDAALVGLERGEGFTAPGLADAAEWDAYREVRRAFYGKLIAGKPAARYVTRTAA